MKMKLLGILFIAALLAIAPGYGSAQPSKDTSPATQPQDPAVKGEPAGTAKSFTPAERQAYEAKTAAELDAMEQRIGDLITKSRQEIPQKKRQFIRIIRGLQVRTQNARNQLAALEKAPETTWSGLKPGMDKTMVELRKAWDTSEPYLK